MVLLTAFEALKAAASVPNSQVEGLGSVLLLHLLLQQAPPLPGQGALAIILSTLSRGATEGADSNSRHLQQVDWSYGLYEACQSQAFTAF